MMPSTWMKSLLLAATCLLAPLSLAQPAGGPGGGGAPPDFAAMREQFAQRMKEMLGATDDEWKVMQPMIDKVQQLQRDSAGRGRFGFGGPGGPGGPGGDQPLSEAQKAQADMQAALENEKSTAEDFKAKLKAIRDARAKAKADLTKSQEELRGILTARQEATLVLLGVLD